MNLNQFLYFIELSKAKNFTRAAEKLFISQPSLSQQISSLEKELDIQLLIRQPNKSLELTKAGEDFLAHAMRIKKTLDDLQQSMDKYKNEHIGTLRIGLLWTFGYADIGSCMNSFMARYPQTECIFTVEGSTVLFSKLRRKELDAVFITNMVEFEDMKTLKTMLVGSSSMGVVAHHSHAFKDYTRLEPKDLDKEKLFMVSKYSNVYPAIERSLKEAGSNPHIIGESSQADIICQIVQSGIALGFLSEEAFRYIMPRGTRFIPYTPRITRDIILCTNESQKDNPFVQALFDYVDNFYFDIKPIEY